MRLSEYLDDLSWSQADLAREARVSPASVQRALRRETISRRVASDIAIALSKEFKETIRVRQIEGLVIAPLRRRKRPIESKAEPPAAQSRAESSAKQKQQG